MQRRLLLTVLFVLAIAALPAVADATPQTGHWVARYNGTANGDDTGVAVAVSPDGAKVFSIAISDGSGTSEDWATAGYNAVTGVQLWAARFTSPGSLVDKPAAVGVSPDSSKVYVTGNAKISGVYTDFITIAYDATTGAQVWINRFDLAGSDDDPFALVVDPDGSRLYATGFGYDPANGEANYLTIAYDTLTGARVWTSTWDGAGRLDKAFAIALSGDGSRVFVTGISPPAGFDSGDYATVAYDSATGAQQWVSTYDGAALFDEALSVAANPDGSLVYVTGESSVPANPDFPLDYATVAYDQATGAQQWVSTYNGTGAKNDTARSVAVSPDGSTVYVTGNSWGVSSGNDYATIAYDAATGSQSWVTRLNGSGNGPDTAYSLGLSPDGTRLFVTGSSWSGHARFDYATPVYNAPTGAQLALVRYNGPASGDDSADSLVVSAATGSVFFTGGSRGVGTAFDMATVALTF
jgi:hypothetical protein